MSAQMGLPEHGGDPPAPRPGGYWEREIPIGTAMETGPLALRNDLAVAQLALEILGADATLGEEL